MTTENNDYCPDCGQYLEEYGHGNGNHRCVKKDEAPKEKEKTICMVCLEEREWVEGSHCCAGCVGTACG